MAVSYVGLHPTLRTIVRNLPRVSREFGFRYRITSAYRSPTKQAKLYRDYLAGLTPYVVAPPGTSLHERGLAIDVVSDDQQNLASILTSAGLSWGGAADPVHFQIGRLKSKATPFKSYSEEVGSSIPAFLTDLPVVGFGFSLLKDPKAEAKKQASTLLDVLLGWL